MPGQSATPSQAEAGETTRKLSVHVLATTNFDNDIVLELKGT